MKINPLEIYIAMCKKLPDLQKEREIIIGNRYYDIFGGKILIIGTQYDRTKPFNIFNDDVRNVNKFTWIPYQFQLQQKYIDYLKKNSYDYLNDLELLYLTLDQLQLIVYYYPVKILFSCYEQMWLALYEARKSGLYWNGENWTNLKD